jgi:hypothetical protein
MSNNRFDFCMYGYRYAACGDSCKPQSYSMVASLLDVKIILISQYVVRIRSGSDELAQYYSKHYVEGPSR